MSRTAMRLLPAVLAVLVLTAPQAWAYGASSQPAQRQQAMPKTEPAPKMEAMPKADAMMKLQVMQKEGLGPYIADAKGMTLYYFTKDAPGGGSQCMGECLQKWPPLAAGKMEPMAGMDMKDFGVTIRPDGFNQATFKGYPLYYFFKDAKAGDTNGQGVNNVWYVIDPAKFPPKAESTGGY